MGRKAFPLWKYGLTALLCALTCSAVLGTEPSPARNLGSTLRVGVLNPPVSLNFFGATDIWSKRILQFFEMPLYVHDPVSGHMRPWLAASPPEIMSDPYSVTIRLREAKWNDGSAVTADDVAFTVRTIQEFHVPVHWERWQMVRKVEVLDPRTVRFVLDGPSSTFLSQTLFTGFIKKKEWAPLISAIRGREDALKTLLCYRPDKPASNGPFYLETYKKPYYILLKRNPHFFASNQEVGKMRLGPYVDRILFDFHPTAAEAVAELERGGIDFFWGDVPFDWLPDLKKDPRMALFVSERKGYDYLAFNLNKSPFKDLAFRQAVAVLLDRQEMIKQALEAKGIPAYSVIPPYNTTRIDPYIPVLGQGLSRNERVERARAMLEKAGYSWAKGTLVLPDGREMKPMEILTTRAGYESYRLNVSFMIKRWLSDAGIPVDVRTRPMDTILTLMRRRSFDVCLIGWALLPYELGYLNTFFYSREAVAKGKNDAGFRNGEFDKLADDAGRETRGPQRQEIVYKMQRIIARELPIIPLYLANIIEAARKDRFSGWVKMPGGVGNLWSFMHVKPMN